MYGTKRPNALIWYTCAFEANVISFGVELCWTLVNKFLIIRPNSMTNIYCKEALLTIKSDSEDFNNQTL